MSSVYAQKNLTDTTGFPSTLEILLAGLDTVAFQLAGTFTGTVVFEATLDRTTYTALSVTPSTGAAAVTSATAAGIWAADGCAGFLSVRARCSVFASGVIIASVGAGANSVAAVTAASDGQVLFMSGTAPSGDSGLTWDSTNNDLEVGTDAVPGSVTIGQVGGTDPPATAGSLRLVFNGAVSSRDSGGSTDIQLAKFSAYLGEDSSFLGDGWIILRESDGQATFFGDQVFDNGHGVGTDKTIGHTMVLRAYDVDGGAYKTFLTLTNGNTPDATLSAPAGATMVIQPTTYKSSDGSSGVTAGPFTVISAITVKNGLITAITGT